MYFTLPPTHPFILNVLIATTLFVLLQISSVGIGAKLLSYFPRVKPSKGELLLLSTSLGWGIVAYGVFFLGMFKLLTLPYISLWLVAILLMGFRKGLQQIRSLGSTLYAFFRSYWERRKGIGLGLFAFLILTWLLSFMMTLTPPWDYDGLMYHLEGPRRFLERGQIFIIPDNWGINGPANGEMIFTIGLAFGSDVFPKIMHWFFGMAFSGTAYLLGKRFFHGNIGFLALSILSGIHYLPFLASWAYIDLIWCTYDVLSIYALLAWLKHPEDGSSWLILCGLFLGLALSSKYLALTSAATIGLVVIIKTYRQLKTLTRSLITLGSIAFIAAVPWYLKNMILTGNPIYPLLFGGKDFPVEHWKLLETYLHSFGTGRSLADLSLLPINIYIKNDSFVTFYGSIDIPSLLFPLTFSHPLLHRKNKLAKTLYMIIGLRTLFWFFTTQQTRFLYPVFPLLSVLTAHTLQRAKKLLSTTTTRIISISLIGGQYAGTIVYMVIFLFTFLQPWRLWSFKEDTASFLKRVLPIYETFQIIQTQIPEHEMVLMLWEGEGYYCPEHCLPDTEHTNWIKIGETHQWNVNNIANYLLERNVHYLLVGLESVNFSLLHDPTGMHQKAYRHLIHEFLPDCGTIIQSNELFSLYKISCTP